MKKMKKWKKLALIAMALMLWAHGCKSSDSKLRSKVVKLSSLHGMCSGEQVRAPSGEDYILTAAHCRVLAEGNEIRVTDEEGHELMRKIIAEDPKSDLLLLEGLPGVKGLPIADSVSAHEHVRTFTHGANLATHKTEGETIETKEVQIGISTVRDQAEADKCTSSPKYQIIHLETIFGPLDICAMQVDETAATASIVPGSSGGMMINDSDELVGVASCTDGQFGYFVTLRDIQKFLAGY